MNADKSQVRWGIDLFRAFILFAARRGTLSPTMAIDLQKKIETLSQEEERGQSPSVTADGLNAHILSANAQMRAHTDLTHYAPFPPFSFVKEGRTRSAVLDQLDMVERTLTEAAHAHLLTWDIEEDFFADILKMFSEVEKGKIAPSNAMAALTGKIEKINAALPLEFQLPSPDLTAYEVPL